MISKFKPFTGRIRAIARDVAQGAFEDQAKDMMGMPHLQTGNPSLGGGCATLLRKIIESQSGEQPAHTPFQAVSMFQAKGFTLVESLLIFEGRLDLLRNSSLQRLVGTGAISPADVAFVHRHQIRTLDPVLATVGGVVAADRNLKKAKADAAAAEIFAARSLSDFLADAHKKNN